MAIRLIFMVLAILIGQGAVWSQEENSDSTSIQSLQEKFKGTTPQETSSADIVTVESMLSKNGVPAGSSVRAAVLLKIEEGWHINAHQPTLDYLIGTSIYLVDQPGITQNKAAYAKSKSLEFEFAEEAIDVYEKTAPIILNLATSDTLSPGNYTLKGTARVQACNNLVCLTPANVEVSVPVEIIPKGSGYEYINNELFRNTEDK